MRSRVRLLQERARAGVGQFFRSEVLQRHSPISWSSTGHTSHYSPHANLL